MPLSSPFSDKIVNPKFAQHFMRSSEPYGAFKAYVRFAEPEKTPAYMEVMELHSPGWFKVTIPCSHISVATGDANVLSIELREHTT